MIAKPSAEAYPLYWPEGWPRTLVQRRQSGKFDSSFAKARDHAVGEVHRLGGRYAVVSSNIPLRRDGLPYAGQAEPCDPGIAVYFLKGDQQMVFACDRYNKTWKNLRAIGKTIEAIRGIERWGASDMMERALSAFEALPPPGNWRAMLGFPTDGLRPNFDEVKSRYRDLVKTHHPDAGGNTEQFRKINEAFAAARKEFGETVLR